MTKTERLHKAYIKLLYVTEDPTRGYYERSRCWTQANKVAMSISLGYDDLCECEHYRDDHYGNCNALTMNRMARCSCPAFVKALGS